MMKRIISLVAVLVVAFGFVSPKAYAIFISDIGRNEYVTFFRGQFFTGYDGGNNAGAVFPYPAYIPVHDVDSFVQLTHDYLYSPTPQGVHDANDQIGAAAYIVDAMIGKKGPDFGGNWNAGVQFAKDNWADWESRVRYYDSKGWINYDDNFSYCAPFNHYNEDYTLSDVFAYHVSSGGCDTDHAISFMNPDGTYFRLLKDCGNPHGNLSPLQPPPPPPPPPAVNVQPYTTFYNGDAQAGASFDCSVTSASTGQISMFGDTSSGNGSGAQIGAFAPGGVEGFASAQRTGSVGALTFDDFGSGFCLPEYAALFDVPAVQPYIKTGPYTVNSSIIGTGARMDILVRGDIYIDGSMVFDTSGAWTAGTIPSFRVISLGGNIYIDPSATQLDGLYVAIPTSAGGGSIYTCATSSGAMTAAQVASSCGNPLTINGAFAAKQIKLLRFNDDVASAGPGDADPNAGANGAAERFVFTPELWLPQPASQTAPGYDYDAISSMPPVL